jgi:hypothetical protein
MWEEGLHVPRDYLGDEMAFNKSCRKKEMKKKKKKRDGGWLTSNVIF